MIILPLLQKRFHSLLYIVSTVLAYEEEASSLIHQRETCFHSIAPRKGSFPSLDRTTLIEDRHSDSGIVNRTIPKMEATEWLLKNGRYLDIIRHLLIFWPVKSVVLHVYCDQKINTSGESNLLLLLTAQFKIGDCSETILWWVSNSQWKLIGEARGTWL